MKMMRDFLYLVHVSQAVALPPKARAFWTRVGSSLPFSKLEPARAFP